MKGNPLKKTKHTTEQIICILRDAGSGLSAEETCRKHSISSQTFYRWRNTYRYAYDYRTCRVLRDESAAGGDYGGGIGRPALQLAWRRALV